MLNITEKGKLDDAQMKSCSIFSLGKLHVIETTIEKKRIVIFQISRSSEDLVVKVSFFPSPPPSSLWNSFQNLPTQKLLILSRLAAVSVYFEYRTLHRVS